MGKKIIITISVMLLIILFCIGSYKLIEFLDFKSSISNLEKHTLLSNEKIVKKFEYNGNDYAISMYHDDSSSWSHLNLFLKYNKEYYVLKNIKKCDTVEDANNLYILNNEIYIHCIGKIGNISKYSINDFNVEEEVLEFNYNETPNISQLHMGIDTIDNNYIYLSSFRLDNTIKNGERVKCSFENKKCIYY